MSWWLAWRAWWPAAWRNPWRRDHCPHPPHRIRHIHGDERNYGYVAECMECGRLYDDWPGGHHDATRCYRLMI